MSACRTLAWSEIRRRWPALLALALLAGLGGATVASAAALARRTATVYDRLEAATGPADVQVMVNAGNDVAEQVAELPGVSTAWNAQVGVAQLGDELVYLGVVGAAEAPPPGLITPRAGEGRLPSPSATDEIAIDQRVAAEFDGDSVVGQRLPLHFLDLEDYRSFDSTLGTPGGPTVEVEVVGTFQIAGGAEDVPPSIVSEGFVRAHPDALVASRLVFVQLDGGDSAMEGFRDRVEEIGRTAVVPAGAEEFSAVDLTFPGAARREAEATTGVLVSGLALFALVTGLVALVLLSQAVARYQDSAAQDHRVEAVLGLTLAQRLMVRALAMLPAAAVATALTVVGVVVSAGLQPLGSLRAFEPDPGRTVNAAVAMVAAVVVPVGLLLLAAIAGWRTARRAVPAAGLEHHAPWVGRSTGSPAMIGLRFALGRDRASGPMRSAAIGVAVGAMGVAAGLVFGASIDRLVETPARYGFDGDFSLAGATRALERRVADDPEVEGATTFESSQTQLNGRQVDVMSFRDLAAPANWWVIRGHLPASAQEVMLGPRLARTFGVGIGDEVTGPRGEELSVAGIGIGPSFGSADFDSGVLVTPDGLARLDGTEPFQSVAVRVVPDADADEVAARYGRSFELTIATPPRSVANLSELGNLPTTLVGFLALVGMASLANAIFVAARRRRRDLAVLRVLGHTPSSNRRTVMVMAIAATTAGVVVGVPVGVAVGRTLWRVVAEGASVSGDALVPSNGLLWLVAGVALLAVVVAAVPAWRAGRRPLGAVLRAE